MDSGVTLCPGGANLALTASESTSDLAALQGSVVMVWCDDQDVYLSASPVSGAQTLVTGTAAASATALIADRIGKGTKVLRRVGSDRYLVAKTVTGTGTLRIKVVSRGQQ